MEVGMQDVDPNTKEKVRKLFPELTDTQFEILIAFSFLSSRKVIAFRRGVSCQAVSKALKECCEQYEVPSAEDLRPLVLLKLGLAHL
jgi:hypothetical protein